jgi:hypothetical protein
MYLAGRQGPFIWESWCETAMDDFDHLIERYMRCEWIFGDDCLEGDKPTHRSRLDRNV